MVNPHDVILFNVYQIVSLPVTEVVEMSTGPLGVFAARTIEELRRIFTVHGLPQQIVSENGPQFVSEQFTQFL